jgi:two-component system response regulator ResD
MSRPRVLLADDDPRVVSVVSRYLDLEGYEMSIATDGEAAVRIAEADRPDLIILDIMMPGIDGIEACRRIRASPVRTECSPNPSTCRRLPKR